MTMIIYTVLFVLIWYSTSTGCSLFLQEFFSSSQLNENNLNIYTIICVASFIQNISCLIGIIILYLTSRKLLSLNMKYSNNNKIILIFAGILHSIGTLIMNLTLIMSNIPCVHTIRALEPLLSSLLLCIIPLKNKNKEKNKNNNEKYIGIILILLGVILSTWRSDQCNLFFTTIILGMLTNLIMVSRNISIQYINIEHNEILTQIFLYLISTLLSFLLLLLNDLSYLLIKKNLNILCLIGLCSFLYNSTSITICSRINLISHSILTQLKRPILILASIIYFHTKINLMMILGNIIIIIGILFYKINLIRFIYQSRQRFILFIILNLIIFFSIGKTFISLSYRNEYNLLHDKNININKDFPLFYWRLNNINENFGDKLSHILIKSIVGFNISLITDYKSKISCGNGRLLAIGSIFHYVCANDVIWGSGILNPLEFPSNLTYKIMHTLDIRSVRGPRTRQFLISKYNISVPEIYGDPALLLPYYLTSYKKFSKPTISILLILHYIDAGKNLISPRLNPVVTVNAFLPWNEMLNLILQSSFVISTSLHGIIVAEAFGIPARLLKSPALDLFKFYDYYEGTNRTLRYATTLYKAISMGGEKLPNIDLKQLLNAVPIDKFRNNRN